MLRRLIIAGLLGLGGRLALARPPDTIYIAWPCTLSSAVATFIPQAERLGQLPDGRLVLRYWEGPRSWPEPDSPLCVAMWPVLPDTGYPRADFTVPPLSVPDSPAAPSLFWPILLALLLALLLFHRPLAHLMRKVLRRLYWRLRWEAFLLRHSGRSTLPLPVYARAVFRLIFPYCDFHPGSLVPAELSALSGPPPLCAILRDLIPPLYGQAFLARPLSTAEYRRLLKHIHIHLRAARPYISRPHLYRLRLCSSS